MREITVAHIGQPTTGVGTYIKSVIRNLKIRNLNTVLISDLKSARDIRDFEGESIESYYVPFTREINPIKDLLSIFKVLKILRNVKPNLIHAHSSKCGYIGRLVGWILGIPVLYTPNAFSYLSSSSVLKTSIYKSIEIIGRYTGATLLACSNSEAQRGVNDLYYSKEKILIWKNSISDIDTSNVSKNRFGRYFCSIGRPSYQKNHQMLIRVYSKVRYHLPDYKLIIVGAGYYSPEKKEIEDLIEHLNLKGMVIVLDNVERQEALSILYHSSLYLMTSRYEGLPFSVLEALALGKPCVLTDVDGNRDCIIDGENGFLITDFNENEMTEKTLEIIRSKELREKMGKKSRKKFLFEFNIENNIKDLEDIYMTSFKR